MLVLLRLTLGKMKWSSIMLLIRLVSGSAITSADMATSFGGILSTPTEVPNLVLLIILRIFDGSAFLN